MNTEWQQGQGDCLECGRLWARFPTKAALICTVEVALRGYLSVKGGGVTLSQLNLQSLTRFSVYGRCRLQQGAELLAIYDFTFTFSTAPAALLDLIPNRTQTTFVKMQSKHA